MSDNAGQFASTYRLPRRRGAERGRRRLALIALGLGGALLLLFVLANLAGRRNGPLPVIEADPGPVRVRPANPGGLQIAGLSDAILSGDTSSQDDQLLPPPEAPAPQALARAETASSTQSETKQAASSPGPAQPAAPRPWVPPAAAAPPAPPSPQATGAKPEASRAPLPSAPARPSAPPLAPPGKGVAVQLAALGSEQAARGEWERLSKRMPDLLGGHQPDIVPSERDGRRFFRLRLGGFGDTAQASLFCDRARAKGAACSIASF